MNTINIFNIKEHIPIIFSAIIIFFSFFLLSQFVKYVVSKKIKTHTDNTILFKLIGNSAKNLLLIIGVISSLGTLGINISAMIAGLGITGFALGFAMKDIFSNLISGILILIYKPFNINDNITIDKYSGTVKEVNLRYTTILVDENKILIPNSFMYSKPIEIINN